MYATADVVELHRLVRVSFDNATSHSPTDPRNQPHVSQVRSCAEDLAPGAPALRDLTIRRLGALNHGSVLSPIPGAEVGVIKAKVDDCAARFPEIKPTGTDLNPGVRLELAGVDVDSVIANANVTTSFARRSAVSGTCSARASPKTQGVTAKLLRLLRLQAINELAQFTVVIQRGHGPPHRDTHPR